MPVASLREFQSTLHYLGERFETFNDKKYPHFKALSFSILVLVAFSRWSMDIKPLVTTARMSTEQIVTGGTPIDISPKY